MAKEALLVGLATLFVLVPTILASFEPQIDILPSDVPVTMMERLTNDEGSSQFEDVEHVTPLGTIRGRKEPSIGKNLKNTHHYAFRGIPFAESPVGSLRWADPVDKTGPWENGHLDATKFRPFCPQFDVDSNRVMGAEDCLFLNVFTPSPPEPSTAVNTSSLLPVFVFIHGGAYLRGSSSAHGAGRLLAHDLVLVTANYRLGALGFLATQDEVLPGNYGMLDQVSALRWVQANIKYFGGDPTRVTIGGFSAGSVSVHHHMMSPLSQGLFHGAIMMSGAGKCGWDIQNNKNYAHELAQRLSCPTSSSAALKDCLTNVPTEDLLLAQGAMHRYVFWPLPFAPTPDRGLRKDPFFPAPLENLSPSRVPVIMGVLPNEAALFVGGVFLLAEEPRTASSIYQEAVPYIFSTWKDPEELPYIKAVAENFYFSQHCKSSLNLLFEEMTESLTDYLFTSCIWDAATEFADAGLPVYLYLNSYRDPTTPTWATPIYDRLEDLGVTSHLLKDGVSHGDDMVHVFDFPYALGKFSERDIRVSTILTSMWADFITTGHPQGSTAKGLDIAAWDPVQPGSLPSYYRINVDPQMVTSPYRQKETNLWRQVMGASQYEDRATLNTCQTPNTSNSVSSVIMDHMYAYFLKIVEIVTQK